MLSRQSVNAIIRIKDRLRYLRTFCTYVGYGSTEFAYEPICRRARPRHKHFGEAVSLAVQLIVANSTHPLRAASVLGACLSLISLVFLEVISIACLIRIVPVYLGERDWVYSSLVVSEIVVLTAAATGVLA